MVPLRTGTEELHTNPLHAFPHSQFSKARPGFSEALDLSVVFRAHRVFKFLFRLFCLFGLGHRDFISPKQVFEQSHVLITRRGNLAGDPGTAHLLSLKRHHQ